MTLLTEKQKRLMMYNDIITKNKAKLKAGMTLSRQDFVKLFQIPGIVHNGNFKQVHKSNLALVNAQTEINILMRENGLNLRSRDYYSEFTVSDKERTVNTIIRYSSEVDRSLNCVSRLADTMEDRLNKNTWGTYNRVADKRIKTMGSYTDTPRHAAVRVRVKHF